MTKRRTGSRSAASQADIALKSNATLLPPAHVSLDDNQMPFFNSLIAEHANTDWTTHRLELAAMCDIAMYSIVENEKELLGEGHVLTRETGSYINPRVSVVKQLTGTVLGYRRTLSLQPQKPTRDGGRLQGRREKQEEIRETSGGTSKADLIAKPNV